jgi:maltooligosyltrehalose trehalohydrolase
MGEEYAEKARFQFFISHGDADLVEAVRRGRREEFRRFAWKEDPPDPQDEATFAHCRLDHDLKNEGQHRALRDYYRALIRLRKEAAPLAFPDRERMETTIVDPGRAMSYRCWSRSLELYVLFHFGSEAGSWTVSLPAGSWELVLDSASQEFQGPGISNAGSWPSNGRLTVSRPPFSVVVYQRNVEVFS